jgi:hypothetical protein
MFNSSISGSIQGTLDKLTNLPKEVTRQLHPFVVEITPIDKHPKAKNPGNAKRNTTYDGNTTIHANYDYAERLLHEGWSDQLPAGTFDSKVTNKVAQLTNDYLRKL